MDLACACLQNPSSDCDITEKTWGVELATLTPDRQIYVQKAVSGILFEGRLNSLHRDSVTVRKACTCSRLTDPAQLQAPLFQIRSAPRIRRRHTVILHFTDFLSDTNY